MKRARTVAGARYKVWLEAARPRTLPAALAPVVVGSALAWRDGGFDAGAAGLCLVFALLIQVGTNFANDYFDAKKGADTEQRVGPRRAVAAGLITPAHMHRAMVGTFAAAFLLGLLLIRWGGPWLLVVGIACILCGYAYTGGPYPLGYHGLGDAFVFLFFGLVAVCTTYFVQTGSISVESVLAAVPIGALAANILVVNNYRDAETDAETGKNTLVVRWGRGFARAQFTAAHAVAMIVPVLFWARGHPAGCLLPLILLPVAVWHGARLRHAAGPPALNALLGDTGLLLAGYALLFSAGLTWPG